VSVSRYGATTTVEITEQVCLWYGVWRIGQPARRALDGRRKRCVNKRAGRWTAAPTHGYNLGGLDNLAEETLERIRHE
jgi:hypothetical protein